MINSDANPDVAINIYRSSTNSMPEVNLKNLIGNKFADVVITRNGTSYSVGPRAGIGTRYLQRTSSISILVEANICGRGQRRLRFTHMMFLIMFSPDFMVEKYEKSRKILN